MSTSPLRRQRTRHPSSATFATAALAALVALVMQTSRVHTEQPAASLPYSRGFLVTGDYAVGGVDLREAQHPIVNGFSTASIPMSGVPVDADILAAYLFWETVTTGGDAWQTEAAGVRFRGFDLDVENPLSVRRTEQPSEGAACFGSGSLTMHMFMADVLRFLPVKVDNTGKSTGKRLVNDVDLNAQGVDLHSVTLPVSDGNHVPESAGASLVVVYRDPSPNTSTNPLRKIVIYGGNVIKPDLDTPLNLTIAGFYGSAANKSARITHIVSSGQPNDNLQFSFTGAGGAAATIAGSPFTPGPASQRWWANPTADVSALMTPNGNSSAYGETVSTSIVHSPSSGGYDCLASGAVVFSTAVEDEDSDGLPDALENAQTPLLDANGSELPHLFAMGAGDHGLGNAKDVFIEINAMRAGPGTSYGSASAPFSATETIKTDSVGHIHMPTPYVLRLVGDAFAERDIRVHFDVGDLTRYRTIAAHCIPDEGEVDCTPVPGIVEHADFVDDYTSPEADAYLIATGARGGEVITETACDPGAPDAPKGACHFPDYPGAVPWKLGLQAHRDGPVDATTGDELADVSTWDGVRRRFDPARRGLFKYALYAHSRGNPRSLPCLVDGVASPYLDQGFDSDGPGPDTDTPSCLGMDNPDFEPLNYHVPTSASGVAELPGGNFMVTLGFWDEFVGRPFVRASTTFHELGHTLGLFHGGPETALSGGPGGWEPGAVIWGNATTPTFVEPNCKPNYFSSMSYLFQVHGLFDNGDDIHLDYAWVPRQTLDETALSDGQVQILSAFPSYLPAWFAPSTSPLASTLGVAEAKRFCTGERFTLNPQMARVHAETSDSDIDWNGNGLMDLEPFEQDVNFDNDGSTRDLLRGLNDWDNIRLNQTGAVVTGVSGGSAEGVFFDNSGVFFDQSGVWFDQSGVWFDNAGGVFFDNSGVFFDNAGGVWFDNSGVWFDNAGGVWFDNAGGVFFDNAGGVFFDNAGGVFFDNAGGVFFDNSGLEMTFEEAKSVGRGRPHNTETCVIGRDDLVGEPPDMRQCSVPGDNGENNHRIEVQFEQLQVGGVDTYQIERKSVDALPGTPDADFAPAGNVAAHLVNFIDPAELANGKEYTYRVQGLSSDEFGNSGYSTLVTETAVNEAPVAADDPNYTVRAARTLNVPAPGVLGNDVVDVDSPATSRRLFDVTSEPAHGTLSWNTDGSFIYTPDIGFLGVDHFTYIADNGPWSGNPDIPLSPPSAPATVTITVTPNDPTFPPEEGLGGAASGNARTFRNVQNLPPGPKKSSETGSTIALRWKWLNSSGAPASAASEVIVKTYACTAGGRLPAGQLLAQFDPSRPGKGNAFHFNTSSKTWSFNWTLRYSDGGGTRKLPEGTYVVQVINPATQQIDPAIVNNCGGSSITGALIKVVKP
jgi:hypothetical protein